jgi:murein DD-endopeptidase MepM/ murein hydrolase activator NlpD
VTEAGWDDAYGYYVQIDHGYGIKTLYAHADMLVVSKGERVAQGQTIAYSGNTGRSTAPHLHFQVTQNNVPVDPLKYLLE